MTHVFTILCLLVAALIHEQADPVPAIVVVTNPEGWVLPDLDRLTQTNSAEGSYHHGTIHALTKEYVFRPSEGMRFCPVYNVLFDYPSRRFRNDILEEQWVLYARTFTLKGEAETLPLCVQVVFEPHGMFPKAELQRRMNKIPADGEIISQVGVVHMVYYCDLDRNGVFETEISANPGTPIDEILSRVLDLQRGNQTQPN